MSPNAVYVREREQWLKARGICVTCGNADAEPGRIRCRRCLDVRNELSRKWKQEHPERWKAYMSEYQREYRRKNYSQGAGRLKPKKSKITKPAGTCRREGCWESAIEFSCWCPVHLEEMRERRCLRDYLRANG